MRRSNKMSFENVTEDQIDYKNIELLKKFIMECGRIVPSRMTNVSAKMQRKITREIKKARFLGLLIYCENHKK